MPNFGVGINRRWNSESALEFTHRHNNASRSTNNEIGVIIVAILAFPVLAVVVSEVRLDGAELALDLVLKWC